MSELDKPLRTPTPEEVEAHKSSLSELLRVGADANAMLLGQPPEAEGEEPGEETRSSRAEADSESRASRDESSSGESPRPSARSSSTSRAPAIGLVLSAVGVLVLVGQQLSATAAQSLGRFVDPRVLAGALIGGGLLLVTYGLLRRTLASLQVSVDDVAVETARLERIATDSRSVLDALHTVRLENTTLKDDVVKLQVKIKRLTEIVSNPDYAGSIFRLAASVDMLGKHVEVHMKEQFAALHQRLSATAQQAERAEQQLKGAFAQLHSATKEQLRVQHAAVQEGFERQHAVSDKSAARLDQGIQLSSRIETTIKSQQEAIAKGWAGLADRVAASGTQVAKDLAELRARIDGQVEAAAAALHADLEDLDSRIGSSERTQAAGIQELAERVQNQVAGRIEEVQQGLRLVADAAGKNQRDLVVEFDELGARLDRQAQSQIEALDSGLEKVDARIGLAERSQTAGLKQVADLVQGRLSGGIEDLQLSLKLLADLSTKSAAALDSGFEKVDARIGLAERAQTAGLEQVADLVQGHLSGGIEDLQQSLKLLADLSTKGQEQTTRGIDGIGGRLEQQTRAQQAAIQKAREATVEDLQQGLKTLADLSSKSRQEIAAEIGELGARVDKQAREQQATLAQARDRATEATRTARGELGATLEQLRKELEAIGRENAASLHRSSQEVQLAAGAARNELAANLEQASERLEKALEARTRSLTNDMLEVGEAVHSITAEVRACIAESMLRVASSNAELAASRGREVEWPRIEVEPAETEPAATAPVEAPPQTLPASEARIELESPLPADPAVLFDPTVLSEPAVLVEPAFAAGLETIVVESPETEGAIAPSAEGSIDRPDDTPFPPVEGGPSPSPEVPNP